MEIQLTKPQAEVWLSRKRFTVLLAGRRFGKSVLALAWIIDRASRKKGDYWYVAPTRKQAKDIAWRKLKTMLAGHYVSKLEDELEMELNNGSIISLRSADNPDSLHGSSLSGVVLDECRFMRDDVWEEAISPATSDTEGDVFFITTPPETHNWFTELVDEVRHSREYAEEWSFFQYTTLEGGNVSEKEVERARKQLDPRTFRRMYEASIETMGNKVYSEFSYDTHVTEDIDVDLNSENEIHIGIDFNRNPMSAVIAVQAGDQLHIIDEIVIPDSNTYELAQEIVRRYPNPTKVMYPDRSASNTHTSAAKGITNVTILEGIGIVDAHGKNPAVLDRVNTVQALLRNAAGGVRIFFHPRCKEVINGLRKQGFKKGTQIPDKDSGYDHMNDALGYLCWATNPVMRALPKINVQFAV